jgi:N-carbamoyl-L-amino-acid hydrolase
MSEIARRHALEIDVQQPINKPPVDFAGDLVDTIRAAVNDCGYSSMDILSGAGHDAMNIARVAPRR